MDFRRFYGLRLVDCVDVMAHSELWSLIRWLPPEAALSRALEIRPASTSIALAAFNATHYLAAVVASAFGVEKVPAPSDFFDINEPEPEPREWTAGDWLAAVVPHMLPGGDADV